MTLPPDHPRRSTLPALARAARATRTRERLEALVGERRGEYVVLAAPCVDVALVACRAGHVRFVSGDFFKDGGSPRRCRTCARGVDVYGVRVDIGELANAAGILEQAVRKALRRGIAPEELVARRRRDDQGLDAAVASLLEREPEISAIRIASLLHVRLARALAAVRRVRARSTP